jgi:hypothetical protein
MPKYVGTVRSKAADKPLYVKKGGGLTHDITKAKIFHRKHSSIKKRSLSAMNSARNHAATGQLYDAEEIKPSALPTPDLPQSR